MLIKVDINTFWFIHKLEYCAYLKNSKLDKERSPIHIVGKESSHYALYLCRAHAHMIVNTAWNKMRRTHKTLWDWASLWPGARTTCLFPTLGPQFETAASMWRPCRCAHGYCAIEMTNSPVFSTIKTLFDILFSLGSRVLKDSSCNPHVINNKQISFILLLCIHVFISILAGNRQQNWNTYSHVHTERIYWNVNRANVVVLNSGRILRPRDTGLYLETVFGCHNQGGCYWCLVSRGQGCC